MRGLSAMNVIDIVIHLNRAVVRKEYVDQGGGHHSIAAINGMMVLFGRVPTIDEWAGLGLP